MTEPTANQTNLDTMLGRLVVERGLATSDEVDSALIARRETSGDSGPNQKSLAQMLIESGVVTRAQLDRLSPEIDEARAGRQIPGYQILGKLGAGAMATVYKARQLSLDRVVAIKVLPKKYSRNPEFIRRFYDEGRAAAKLNHPNLVAAIDVGQSGEYHYFVMEFVDGKTVYDDITEQGTYSEEESLNIAIQVAQALAHAHEKGFIHRDVKPKNIMFTRDGVAKLADMGLARAVSDKEAAEAEAGKAFGTPYYISPEQIRGIKDVDPRADIYSLGATLFHMVTGRVPFDGANPSAVMSRHLKDELTPPDHLNPKISHGIAEIIEVCMAKDRELRYPDTQDLILDLEAVRRGEPPSQSKRHLDLDSLSVLESSEELEPTIHDTGPLLVDQPLFWVAVAGWLVAVAMLAILLLT